MGSKDSPTDGAAVARTCYAAAAVCMSWSLSNKVVRSFLN